IRGQNYEEVLTNFPFGNQILTGLFLNMTLSGPGVRASSYEKALIDRVGLAARRAGNTQVAAGDPSGPPILSNLDLSTVNALPGLQSQNAIGLQLAKLPRLQGELVAIRPTVLEIPATGPLSANQTAVLASISTVPSSPIILT